MVRGYEYPSTSDVEQSAPFISYERLEKIRVSKALRSVWKWICLIARNVWRYILVGILSSIVTTAVLRGHDSSHVEQGLLCEDMDYTREYAPIRDLDRSYHVETFSPFNYSTSEYTMHPSKGNVSERWMALGQDSGHFLIPVSEGYKYDLDIKRHVTIPDGVAEQESFLVSFDVMHQIHCLDTIRENLWYNRDWYSIHQEQHPKLSVHKAHTDHCINALRERLMCLSDVTFLPLVYIDREGWTLPDFERRHKCHNFDATREWAYKHRITDAAAKYRKIAGPEKILTAFPGFYDIYPERNNSDHKDPDHKNLDNKEHSR